ncbi:hypothetical protein SAMN05421810_102415 [Amycolatopsis arida]|uniref:Uncharacterized protein n=1 Tax=Amycolatopsis arida TaxID=587909 RepID=A0A1I5PWV8_9PSEU|nr:DUF4064 domain-containing protein [Amycolatopsis arida]TDX98622.1 hypothetical protein CLV69_101415 [Amycolatopsis arida]SFP38101.1 hypothetical protein SAMN05421810_102415 [Amycolatopsis arida]
MSYPQYPAPSGFPPAPGQIDPARPPSGGTAITAGVLAVLGGLFAIYSAISSFTIVSVMKSLLAEEAITPEQRRSLETAVPDWAQTYGVVSGVAQLVVVALLITGGVLLFVKKSPGRWLVVAGCAAVIVLNIASVVVGSTLAADVTSALPGTSSQDAELASDIAIGFTVIFAIITSVPAIATLILAAVPATGRWCAYGRQAAGGPTQPAQPPGYPQSGPFPQPTGYGQPGAYGQLGTYPGTPQPGTSGQPGGPAS